MKKDKEAKAPVAKELAVPVEFAALSAEQQQAWVDFRQSEIDGYQEGIDKVLEELSYIKTRYGITPRKVFVATWVAAYQENKKKRGG